MNTVHNILLVDDDQDLCDLLTEYLNSEGFKVTSVHDGEQAVTAICHTDAAWDAVILDVMLPGMNGFDVLKAVREKNSAPILMLTARGEDIDTVLGLELGADDYVTKPVSPRVLIARIRALLRRKQPQANAALQVGDIQLNEAARQVAIADRVISLTGAEFNLLTLLVKSAGHVVSREVLAKEGLGRALQAYDRRIETHMAQIRRKLGTFSNGNPRIETVRGAGYQYVVSNS